MGLYLGILVTSSYTNNQLCNSGYHANKEEGGGGTPASTVEAARQFDRSLDMPERLMGIRRLRKKIAAAAHGHVLEVAMGTGRNLEFYNLEGVRPFSTATLPRVGTGIYHDRNPHLTSYTGVDISHDMLDIATEKLHNLNPKTALANRPTGSSPSVGVPGRPYQSGKLRLLQYDVQQFIPRPPCEPNESGKYDVVIQTFGLCSVKDPALVLSNLAEVVQPNTGRIILLEHGKGWLGCLNSWLDCYAAQHFHSYGCWWNRDIEAIIAKSVQSIPGLELVKLRRPYLLQAGTIVWAELKVRTKV
jgi:methyltransferase OMS1, mitochondrial